MSIAALVLGHWRHIELDLQAQGIDVESGVLHQRSWSWLRLRIAASPTTARLMKGQ